MGIIILEGSDGVGKSTIAEMLSEKLGMEILKGSSFEISELGSDGMFKHMMDMLDKENIIIDRFLWSNLVYGKLYNYPMMTDFQFDTLVEKVDEINATVVYIHTHEGKIQFRLKQRGDDMVKVEEIPNIIAEYKEVLYGDFRPRKILSFDNSNISDLDYITNTIKNYQKGE